MNKNELTYRMYGWVNYQLSGIQSGIQYAHSVIEYSNKYFNTEEYQKWANVDKTFIVLNGGITNDNIIEYGMGSIPNKLEELGVNFATFREPDLNDSLTGIAVLVDERVFDEVNYPFEEQVLLTNPPQYKPETRDLVRIWGDLETGKRMYEFRKYLKSFRLA